MAEETQQDMSMDEILSSIKDILSENGTSVNNAQSLSSHQSEEVLVSDQSSSPSSVPLDETQESAYANDLLLNDEDDGVLDLTSDMRVETAVPEIDDAVSKISSEDSETEIDIDSELADVAEVAADPSNTTVNTSSIAVAPTETDDISSLLPEVNIISDDTDSDPIYIPEDEASSQPLYKGGDEILSDVTEVPTQSDNFNIEEISLTADANSSPASDQTIDTKSDASSDAVDVSASIINNFAKIFADNKSDMIVTKSEKVSPSVKLGADSTLSDMVKATIRDMLSEQIINTLAKDIDIKTLMSSEVSVQIKQWLDRNLPTMVENIVKKEIERVMVKAGKI